MHKTFYPTEIENSKKRVEVIEDYGVTKVRIIYPDTHKRDEEDFYFDDHDDHDE